MRAMRKGLVDLNHKLFDVEAEYEEGKAILAEIQTAEQQQQVSALRLEGALELVSEMGDVEERKRLSEELEKARGAITKMRTDGAGVAQRLAKLEGQMAVLRTKGATPVMRGVTRIPIEEKTEETEPAA